MSDWKVIPAIESLRNEFNTLSPNRDKGADGTIGDSSHTSSSDHTPDEDSDKLRNKDSDTVNEVHALDIDSTGPWPGCTFNDLVMYVINECRKSNGKDAGRLRYIIWNYKIYEWNVNNWGGSNYTATDDPHTNHAHFSFEYGSGSGTTNPENNTSSWGLVSTFGDDLDVDKPTFFAWLDEYFGKYTTDSSGYKGNPVGRAVWDNQYIPWALSDDPTKLKTPAYNALASVQKDAVAKNDAAADLENKVTDLDGKVESLEAKIDENNQLITDNIAGSGQ